MIDKMPDEYKGQIGTKTEYTLSAPRKWTPREIEWLELKASQGFSAKEIAYSMDRTHTSVAIKIKRLSKKENTYNSKHIEEKYLINDSFLEEIKPNTILDLYTGKKNFYKNYNVTTNDIDENIDVEYHKDAFKLICELYAQGKKYDLIDLDPFGSAYDCFDLAIKMASKGICITLGELGHKRWKRLDFVKTHYDINKIEDFTILNLISYIQKIGLRNKKKLIIFDYKEWQNIGRVWFKIEPTEKLKSQVKTIEQRTLFDLLDDTQC